MSRYLAIQQNCRITTENKLKNNHMLYKKVKPKRPTTHEEILLALTVNQKCKLEQ